MNFLIEWVVPCVCFILGQSKRSLNSLYDGHPLRLKCSEGLCHGAEFRMGYSSDFAWRFQRRRILKIISFHARQHLFHSHPSGVSSVASCNY